ncbi:MAG: 4a-hydroxytetrahydrobiopterin dehydratase [Chloroflexi bacterium]|nr:4a-hydroxytetrahydrobiopterin dehydratase [Chloroflexota bacterium]
MTLPGDEVQWRTHELPGWSVQPNALHKEYHFPDFTAAMDFVNRVAGLAEAANHHPDITIRWNRVTLTLTSHDAGGVTERDLNLAYQIEAAVAG